RDWARIESAMGAYRDFYEELMLIENGRAFWSDIAGWARTFVRYADEISKPDGERLPEFRESGLPRLKARLTAEVPVYPSLEIAKLTDSFTYLAAALGAGHPLVELILDAKSPADRAYDLVTRTGLAKVERRKELLEGGADAIREADDPMLELARSVEPFARALRERHDRLVDSVLTESYGRIARASFAVTGTSVYPDATFTLRLAFGVVKGWEEAGRTIPPFTRIEGVYDVHERSGGKDPYELPERWLRLRDEIDGQTHFNFVSTADIIGGNSGSPVINRDGEVVGLIFDGNIHGLVLDISYTEDKARAVSVDASAILESLRAVYGMDSLVKELTSP
ncbi:MAG TPA: S46 family peptidase, partial [Planctomycetota bacterium]|nr:S46 family peptidase [Planctomycetota bacterium]